MTITHKTINTLPQMTKNRLAEIFKFQFQMQTDLLSFKLYAADKYRQTCNFSILKILSTSLKLEVEIKLFTTNFHSKRKDFLFKSTLGGIY